MNNSTRNPSMQRRTSKMTSLFLSAFLLLLASFPVSAFQSAQFSTGRSTSQLSMAQASQQDAQKAIDAVVKALRSDGAAKKELGNLKKVENVLGYGSPQKGKLAVRFNASFQKGGAGFLGFGTLGAPKQEPGKKPDAQRGSMVGQVKASVDQTTGKVLECSVFRDLGYGRSFNLKTR